METKWPLPVNEKQVVCEAIWYGQPYPAPRPRVVDGKAYNDRKYTKAKKDLADFLETMTRLTGVWNENILDAHFGVFCRFYRKGFVHCDKDNLEKTVYDAATEAGIWNDDHQIAIGYEEKYYGSADPRTEILIFTIQEVE